jgi:hypothetical protein
MEFEKLPISPYLSPSIAVSIHVPQLKSQPLSPTVSSVIQSGTDKRARQAHLAPAIDESGAGAARPILEEPTLSGSLLLHPSHQVALSLSAATLLSSHLRRASLWPSLSHCHQPDRPLLSTRPPPSHQQSKLCSTISNCGEAVQHQTGPDRLLVASLSPAVHPHTHPTWHAATRRGARLTASVEQGGRRLEAIRK